MYYYLVVSSWNLLESFATESISPFSFYQERHFGNNLSRYMSSEKEKTHFLILSTRDLGGDISVIIDESLIDKSLLGQIKGLKTAFTYPKTIYYKKGKIKFRFSNPELRDGLIAESKILLEIKCVEKYQPDFYVKEVESKNVKGILYLKDSFSFEKDSYISQDYNYNKTKGALFGYVRGLYTTQDRVNMDLLNNLKDLKNEFGGLHTCIMMGGIIDHEKDVANMISKCKDAYFSEVGQSSSFDVIVANYFEINKIMKLRMKEVTSDIGMEILSRKEELESTIKGIDTEYNIDFVKREFARIKDEEKENGLKKGKTREQYKQGTPERVYKDKLKKIIEEYNKDYELRQLKYELASLDQESSPNKYDSILTSLFFRISDIMNELIKGVSNKTDKNAVSLSDIEISNDSIRIINDSNNPEKEYFNILLKYIIDNTRDVSISEFSVMQMIEQTALLFKSSQQAKTEEGITILNTLRGYWAYKKHKADNFNIPDNMKVLQSIMSFMIKPFDFSQIERYMLIKGYQEKCYAYMLLGAWMGFADMPKTFTNILYQDEDVAQLIEDTI